MKCPKCQFENREEAVFCRKCGTSLAQDITCPNCSSPNPPDSSFCEKCGQDLRESKESPPVDYSAPQSYTPKHLKDKILTTRSSIEGERKLVTVLFADVANYTSMSEKLDPEEVHQIMDGCFKILMDEIHKYEGTINQFTGDGVMALFGAPLAHEDHAQRACHAALSAQLSLGKYGERIKKDTSLDFKMRIGLNSGHVIVGSIGDDLRMDYTAVGDTTNLAARMESTAEPGSVLVSENTFKIARSYFEFEPLSEIKIKGKEEPQKAYRLIKTGEIETRIDASVAKGLTRFVGRHNSMPALMEVWEKAKSGSGQVVGIVGEAGVGKSRILLEFRNRLPQDEFIYLVGQCLQYGENIIYGPIKDIVKAYFDIKEGDREFIVKKKVIEKTYELDESYGESSLPVLQDFLSLRLDDEEYVKLEPLQKRERTFEVIRDLFIRISQRKPLIIVIEDLHWIDRTSEEFLGYLIEWIAKTPIMLTLLYRTEYRHQWGSKTYYNRIGLDHLGTESSTELVKSMLEDGEVAPELKDLILERAAGNPLFMEEFTYSLKENGTIRKENDRYVLSRSITELDVPDTIQGIIAARMDRLEENLKRTMQVASVIGRDFAFRILQTITGMKEELKSYLLNLQGLEFIYEKHLFPELEYIFKHALTREVAYNSLLLKRRKEIHEQIGRAIEKLYEDKLEELYEVLAYHFSKSDDLEKAYRYLRLAGKKATKNHSTRESFRFYKEAISVLNRMPDTDQNKEKKLEVMILSVIPMSLLGFPEDSLEILREGERLSKELLDSQVLARFYSALGVYHTHQGDHAMGMKYSEMGFEEARKIEEIELMTDLAFQLCTSYLGPGKFYKIVDVAQSTLDLVEKTETESESPERMVGIYPILYAYCGNSMGQLGKFEEGIVYCEKGLNVSNKNDLRTLGLCELQYGFLFSSQGNGKSAIRHFQKCLEYVEGMEWIFTSALAWTGLGYGYGLVGDLNTARKHIEKGLSMQREAGIEWWLSLHHYFLVLICFLLGDLKGAQSFIKEALKLAQKNNEKHVEGLSLTWMGRILIKTDQSQRAKAEDYILKGIRILDELKLKPFISIGHLLLGELYVDINRKSKAHENLKNAEENFIEMGMDYWLNKTRMILERL